MTDIYILGGSRTPQGSFLGALSTVSATSLGSTAIKGAIEKCKVDKADIDEVLMGQVIQAGAGQAPARQAALGAGLPESVPCTTINKVCGSGMQAVIMGAKSIMAGDAQLAVCGGMENMSMAPHLLFNSRTGAKFGNTELKDSMQWDGLWDVYSDRPMGNCAEECTVKYKMSREEQDAYAIRSFERAQAAQAEKIFESEITPVTIKARKGDIVISEDEGPTKVRFDKIPQLRAAFDKAGTITAANASTINDGACALLIGGEKYKSQAKFKIRGWAGHAQEPTWFTTAPVMAIKKNLEKFDLKTEDIDLWEINEAFAAVAMAAIKDLEIPEEKINVYGGAVSLGHPIGVSGARIILSLINGLERKNLKRGLAGICIGGGEALSIIIERV